MIGSDCKAFKNVFSLLPSTLFLVFRAHIEIKLDYVYHIKLLLYDILMRPDGQQIIHQIYHKL